MGAGNGIAVIGGGPIGCAVATALRAGGLPCVVLEARDAAAQRQDGRTLALTYASRLILERVGAWRDIDSVTPIKSIHVSQRSGFGRTLLTAAEAGLDALGYVVAFSAVQRALSARLDRAGVEVRAGRRVVALDRHASSIAVHCSDGEVLQAQLAIVADGSAALGEQLGARYSLHHYDQSALVALTRTSEPPGHRAYERFTPHGPAALLPREEDFALVWSCPPAQAAALLDASDSQFLAGLQRHFGDRAGRFVAVRDRAAFPLTLRFARNIVHTRAVLIGNSAQALHPIAGQGFNLGLRDAWSLAELLVRHAADDPGSPALLERYATSRRLDRMAGIVSTDLLTRLFTTPFPLAERLRGAGVALLDLAPPAKRYLMRRMIFGTLP